MIKKIIVTLITAIALIILLLVALDKINEAISLNVPQFEVDLLTGHLMYQGGRFAFAVSQETGNLMWEVAV